MNTLLLLFALLAIAYMGGCATTPAPVPSQPYENIVQLPTSTPTCFTGDAVVFPEDGQFILYGETALCGTDLHWRRVFGPDCQTHVEGLEQRIKNLEMELEQWRKPG